MLELAESFLLDFDILRVDLGKLEKISQDYYFSNQKKIFSPSAQTSSETDRKQQKLPCKKSEYTHGKPHRFVKFENIDFNL